jgi:hypothetical protein
MRVRIEGQWRRRGYRRSTETQANGAAGATKGLKMNDQIETVETELNLEDLDQVQGGIIAVLRKAGGEQEGATADGRGIIAI